LENNSYTNVGDSQGAVPRESRVQEYLSILLRGKWIILACFLGMTAAATIVTINTKPVYEASSLVLIDMKGQNAGLPFIDLGYNPMFNKITNELEILRSRSMATAVAQDLLKQYAAAAIPMVPILQVMIDDVPQNRLTNVDQIAARLLGWVMFVPIRDSDLIKITARSNDPQEAALIANTYTRVYAERNLNASRTRSRAVREFLQDQLQVRKSALDSSEAVLQNYMKSSGIVSLDGESNKVVQQLSSLEASRDALEVEIRSRQKTLESYREEIAKQEPSVARTLSESSDAYIKLLQEKLASLEVQRDIVIAQNPNLVGQTLYAEKLKEIDTQIASLKKTLKSKTEAFLSSLGPNEPGIGSAAFVAQIKQKVVEQQIELEGLDARKRALNAVIQQYERQFNQIPQRSIELAKIQRARLSNEKLYLLVEEKFNEASITEKSEFGYVNIIDPAIVPSSPISPNVRKNIMLGAIVGLALGVGLVLLRSYLDVRVRTPEDLKRFGYVTLSAITHMEEELKQLLENTNGRSGTGDSGFDKHLVTYFNPLSPLSEAFRRLRTNVLYAQLDTPLKTVLVTSPSPAEGKSTTISNLAVTFAQAEKRVLLVDADMRRPAVHDIFNLSKTPGITDILVGTSTFEDAVHRNVADNLDVLCCGTTPPNPAEQLGSRRMQELIKRLSEQYDLVLFDSPPLLAVTDAAVLSTTVDGVIIVVAAGATRAAAIQRATEFIGTVGGKVLGCVLNKFDVRKAYGGYYAGDNYSYYGYGYSHYHSNGNGSPAKKKKFAL
jgi:capsular exopolysaccharide synthesis family protein